MATLDKLADKVEASDTLREEIKTDPVATIRAQAVVFERDRAFYRIAIIGLIVIILLVVGGGIVAELWTVGTGQPKKSLPDGLLALGASALGGLVGLFARPAQD
jgi:uncharacterized integral membrane protein